MSSKSDKVGMGDNTTASDDEFINNIVNNLYNCTFCRLPVQTGKHSYLNSLQKLLSVMTKLFSLFLVKKN